MNKRLLVKQLAVLIAIALFFGLYNLGMYMSVTKRLSNNFSDATKAQMVDVGAYLPHDPSSELPKLQSSLKLQENLPVLDGAAALVPVYASVIDTVYPEGSVTFEGGAFSDDNYYGENFAPDSKMQYRNTVRGYKAVVDGDCDILFCASPSSDQEDYAREKGVELVYVPVGLEAFVFFVNKNNPVDDLTVEEIRSIYGGEYTNWSQVGGFDRVINPVTRLEGSGSQSAMNKFMGERAYGKKSPLAVLGSSIGFSFRYYMDGIVENKNVKMLSLNGVYPSAENIRNGSYPVIAEFYAIYRADNKNENVSVLIDWLLSEEGQALIEANGYVRIK
ncbi:MAG: phosphate ABC transporter substrate-binding protein, PhoT family [Ruminococcaceae bacterium]|nr:phosphate ABC transporter substrate-binding protein, PhoT family [Oscillospiraceae bacterium]